ncbi:MAG: hypothetical protein MJZ70_03960 [Bacteroidales bacterium]|nr:hypothetical protein [Bacteroidales bacterium]
MVNDVAGDAHPNHQLFFYGYFLPTTYCFLLLTACEEHTIPPEKHSAKTAHF